MRDPIRLRRSVSFLGATLEVEAALPPSASPREVVMAGRELDEAAQALRESCPKCGTPWGHVHFPDCPLAGPDPIGRAEAIAEGMRP
jgi:hypothetical protein